MGYAKQTAARLVDQRARRRATQDLIGMHQDEFRDLYQRHRMNAEGEAQALASKARGEHSIAGPPRLMPGARKQGQDATDRIDVARCAYCVKHHDRGHVCTSCGAVPHTVAALDDDGTVDDIAVERAMSGEPTALTPTELREGFRRLAVKGVSDSQIASLLGVVDRTVLRWRQSEQIESGWSA